MCIYIYIYIHTPTYTQTWIAIRRAVGQAVSADIGLLARHVLGLVQQIIIVNLLYVMIALLSYAIERLFIV